MFIRVICFLLIMINASLVLSQNSHFESNHNWRFHRKEFIIGLGTSQFLGDLGGKDQIGSDYSLQDLEFALTQPALQLGFRYRLANLLATRSTLNIGMLKGDDELTEEKFRSNRNLSFRSILIEFGQYLEFNLLVNEKVGKRNNIRGIKGARRHNEALYIFSGITGFFFNPQSRFQGDWKNLQPLGTEGQGLQGEPEPYNRVSFAIPFGFGFKWGISNKWRMAIEASYHKTFTDYVDDVSTDYYNNAKIQSEKGDAAAYFADPSGSDNPTWTAAGAQRGDPDDNDAYFFASLQLIYDFTYSNRRNQWGNGRTTRRRTVKAKF